MTNIFVRPRHDDAVTHICSFAPTCIAPNVSQSQRKEGSSFHLHPPTSEEGGRREVRLWIGRIAQCWATPALPATCSPSRDLSVRREATVRPPLGFVQKLWTKKIWGGERWEQLSVSLNFSFSVQKFPWSLLTMAVSSSKGNGGRG
jgi:hypothetical protein